MFRIVTAAMLLSLAGAAHAGTSFNGPYINGKSFNSIVPNGMLNGASLNGMLNGLSPNGMLNGANLNGILNGSYVNGVYANGGSDSTLDSVILIGVELPR
jgi:hypothetical protein